jgi:protein TonB
MAPIVKDSDTAVALPTPASQSASGSKPVADAAARPQPVALEVPVTINGARTMEGSDKREPFAESTQTVLVFPQGAVIRLASPLAPGQLVFLTNEKTKKEVVCQVVKSKNYRTVTGYVELEFTEPAAGFWGMRFPTSVVAPTTSAGAPVAPRPVMAPPVAAPKIAAPAVPSTIKPVVPPTQNVAPAKAVAPAPVTKPEAQITPTAPKPTTASPTAKVQAPSIAPPVGPPRTAIPSTASPAIPDLAEFLASTAISAPPTKTETPEPASSPSTEELKLQAAKLQEQLSAMLFTETSKPQKATPAARPEEKPANAQTVKKVLELADLAPKPATIPAPSAPASKITPITQKQVTSSFDAEEVQIPAWLAPLANNSETKSSALAAAQETPVHTEPPAFETLHDEASGSHAPAGGSHSIQAEMFGGQLLTDLPGSAQSEAPSKSKKGLLIGVAAGLLIAGGALWYSKQPGNILTGTAAVAPVSTPAANSTPFANDSTAKPESSTTANAVSNPSPSSSPSLSPAKQTTLSEATGPVSTNTLTPAVSKQPSERTRNLSAEPPPAPEPKKPVVGNVQLAKPVVNGGAAAKENGEGTPSIDVNQPASSEGLTSLAAGHAKGPDAPLPIGGDVKQAQLIKSVPPIYPAMAKSQHISGNVKIDALIDASGNVSSMSVLSGPAMLHQAALAAVKQWRYQPAELDGKPTSMHLTVTVQFRLQ